VRLRRRNCLVAVLQHQYEAEFPRAERDREFRTEEIHG
jgi:hypothetical protein